MKKIRLVSLVLYPALYLIFNESHRLRVGHHDTQIITMNLKTGNRDISPRLSLPRAEKYT